MSKISAVGGYNKDKMKPPLWLILHAAAHASMASTEQLFLLVTEPRSGSDWLVDLLDAVPTRRLNLPPEQRHVVAYEALRADTPAATRAIFRFLGVEPLRTNSTYVKTGGHRLADGIANVDDVRQALAGTPWLRELD